MKKFLYRLILFVIIISSILGVYKQLSLLLNAKKEVLELQKQTQELQKENERLKQSLPT